MISINVLNNSTVYFLNTLANSNILSAKAEQNIVRISARVILKLEW